MFDLRHFLLLQNLFIMQLLLYSDIYVARLSLTYLAQRAVLAANRALEMLSGVFHF